MTALPVVPPSAFLLIATVLTLLGSRRTGHAAGVVGGLLVLAWVWALPAGQFFAVPLFGFDAVLLMVDPFSRLLGGVLALVAVVATGYSAATGASRTQHVLALSYLTAGAFTAFAGDWLSLLVGWELLALFATALIWASGQRAAGVRYAIYHEIGGLCLIAAVALHYTATGRFLFGDGITAGAPAVLLALAVGLNAGFVGLHVWIVDSYPRTHVATSVVLAAVTTKVGAYALVRAFPEGHVAVAYVGGGMVLFGVVMAILQTDMRRLLSYHIVSQVGYIVAGFGAGSALAASGAMVHLVNNVLYKSLLFMIAGLLVVRTGTDNLKKVGGVGRAMPLLGAFYVVAVFSIAGVPGFNGFVSKGLVIDGVQKAGLDPLWWILVVGGVGTVVSFAKFGYYAFLHGVETPSVDPLSAREALPLAVLAGACLVFGLAPGLLLDLFPAKAVAGAKPFAGKQFTKAGALLVAGVVLFGLLRTPLTKITPVPDFDAVYHPLGGRLRRWIVRSGSAIEGAVGSTERALTQSGSAAIWGDLGDSLAARFDAHSIGWAIALVVLALAAVLALLVLA